jgi:hypothetical protein
LNRIPEADNKEHALGANSNADGAWHHRRLVGAAAADAARGLTI